MYKPSAVKTRCTVIINPNSIIIYLEGEPNSVLGHTDTSLLRLLSETACVIQVIKTLDLLKDLAMIGNITKGTDMRSTFFKVNNMELFHLNHHFYTAEK